MNILLDTHVFIWTDTEPEKLSSRAASLLQDSANTLFLSVVSVWEIRIKTQLGKLTLRTNLESLLSDQQSVNGLQILPVLLPHALALSQLPPLHKDPFDRLLIAQALHENFTLLSHDSVVQQYPISVAWS